MQVKEQFYHKDIIAILDKPNSLLLEIMPNLQSEISLWLNYKVVWLSRNVKVNYELAELVILTSTSSSDCNMNSLEASLFFWPHHVACGISVP